VNVGDAEKSKIDHSWTIVLIRVNFM
jgi:hypothetical protein